MAIVYNVNNTATQVLAAKKVKENIFLDLVHRNGYGVTQEEATNASTVRFLKVNKFDASARELSNGSNTLPNGGFFNGQKAVIPSVDEYDLNLVYIYDQVVDLPEVQQDMVPINIFDQASKNVGGRIATEINASTIAHQLKAVFDEAGSLSAPSFANLAVVLDTDYYDALMTASSMLDNGDEVNGIQSFPFDERQYLLRPSFRKQLLSSKGVLVGGSNYAQSMIAKGAVSPEDRKEFGSMYCGEIDLTPCYLVPDTIWNRAKLWASGNTFVDKVEAIACAASATDRGISFLDYIKIIDSPDGAGKRMQPKTRWGVNVCYPKGVVPILTKGTAATASAKVTIKAPGTVAIS
jgi:hypothetical protein